MINLKLSSYLQKFFSFILISLIASDAFAATVYARFEGIAKDSYALFEYNTGETVTRSSSELGLADNEPFYFDLAFNLERAPLIGDSFYDEYREEFYAAYIAGSAEGGFGYEFTSWVEQQYQFGFTHTLDSIASQLDWYSYGETNYYVESTVSQLFVNQQLSIGWNIADAELYYDVGDDDPPNFSLENWELGDAVQLMYNNQTISSLEITHLSTEPPSPIPLPASAWLFLSGFLLLSVNKLNKRFKMTRNH